MQFRNREVLGRVTGFRKLGSLLVGKEERGANCEGKKLQLHTERYLLSFREFTSDEGMFAELRTLGQEEGCKTIKKRLCPVNRTERNKSSKR